MESSELLNFVILLVTFRPRKAWPEFYALGIDHLFNNINAGNNREARQARAIVQRPIKTFTINNDTVFDFLSGPSELDNVTIRDPFAFLSTKDAVLVINPCEICDPSFNKVQDEMDMKILDEDILSNLEFGLMKSVGVATLDIKQ